MAAAFVSDAERQRPPHGAAESARSRRAAKRAVHFLMSGSNYFISFALAVCLFVRSCARSFARSLS
jgi:hypothetical protein